MLLFFWLSVTHYKFRHGKLGRWIPELCQDGKHLIHLLAVNYLLQISHQQSSRKTLTLQPAGSAANKISQCHLTRLLAWRIVLWLLWSHQEETPPHIPPAITAYFAAQSWLALTHPLLYATCTSCWLWQLGTGSRRQMRPSIGRQGWAGLPAGPGVTQSCFPELENRFFFSQKWCSGENENCWKWSNVRLWLPRD